MHRDLNLALRELEPLVQKNARMIGSSLDPKLVFFEQDEIEQIGRLKLHQLLEENRADSRGINGLFYRSFKNAVLDEVRSLTSGMKRFSPKVTHFDAYEDWEMVDEDLEVPNGEADENKILVYAATTELPLTERRVMHARYLTAGETLTYNEAAASIGMSQTNFFRVHGTAEERMKESLESIVSGEPTPVFEIKERVRTNQVIVHENTLIDTETLAEDLDYTGPVKVFADQFGNMLDLLGEKQRVAFIEFYRYRASGTKGFSKEDRDDLQKVLGHKTHFSLYRLKDIALGKIKEHISNSSTEISVPSQEQIFADSYGILIESFEANRELVFSVLSPIERRIISDEYDQKLNYASVAEEFNIQTQNVYSSRSKLRKKVPNIVERIEESSEEGWLDSERLFSDASIPQERLTDEYTELLLGQLPAKQRQLLERVYGQEGHVGKEVADIGSELGFESGSATRNQKYRALKSLKRIDERAQKTSGTGLNIEKLADDLGYKGPLKVFGETVEELFSFVTPDQREVLMASYGQRASLGTSLSVIARDAGIPDNTFRARKRRGLGYMRENLPPVLSRITTK